MWCALVFFSLKSLLAGASSVSSLAPAVKAVDGALSELEGFVQVAATRAPGYLELAARDLAYSLARIYMGRYRDHTCNASPLKEHRFSTALPEDYEIIFHMCSSTPQDLQPDSDV